MKNPWKYVQEKRKLEEKVERLKNKLDETEEEREKYREQYKAEKERRSKLSTEKQEAQKELNRLEKKLENRSQQKEEVQKHNKTLKNPELSFKGFLNSIKKISTVKSDDKDLITVYRRKNSDIDDSKGLKNSVNQDVFRELAKEEDFVAFTDEKFFRWKINMRPFYQGSWKIGETFDTDKLLEFIEKDKYWVLASMGETKIFNESSGDLEEVERIKTRVNRKQKKGGFSQGRFERKRDEQVSDHVKKVNEKLKEITGDIYVLGDKRLCKDIEAEYLGGFDASKPVSPDVFYNFSFKRF